VNLQNDQVVLKVGTVTASMQSFMKDLQAGGNVSTSARMRESLNIVDAWVAAVTDPVDPLFNELDDFSNTLTDGLGPQGSPLEKCANAVFTEWQVHAAQKSPVDDRQYFDLLYGWLWSLINLQTQAMQMIQAANQYRCVCAPAPFIDSRGRHME
jgi:hypothetical protein